MFDLRFNDFSTLNARSADPQLARSGTNLSLYRPQIDIPAPTRNVMRMRNVVAELRTFTANCTNLRHTISPNPDEL